MIIQNGWDGKYQLFHDGQSKVPVKNGDKVIVRGDELVVTGGEAPHRDGVSGRVHVVWADRADRSYYPSVCGMSWVKLPE